MQNILEKRKKNPLSLILILLAFGLLIAALLVFLNQRDTAPDDSSAIYGGEIIAPDLFPYAGYLIAYGNNRSGSVCGTAFLSGGIAVSAAHCYEGKTTAYAGRSIFSYSRDDNFLIEDIVVNPCWDGKNIDCDLAVMKIPTEFYESTNFEDLEKGTIGVPPSEGCGITIVGYGKNDNEPTGASIEKLRKSAEFCIEELNSRTFTLRGLDGGVCHGDSGSTIINSKTDEVIGVVSSIIATGDINTNPCAIGNRAIAVRIDKNIDFIESVRTDSLENLNIARCGESCQRNECTFGLQCGIDNFCESASGETCTASAGDYCSPSAEIECASGLTCSLNSCEGNEDIQKADQIFQTDLSLSTSAQVQNEIKNQSTISYLIYSSIGLFILAVFMKILEKIF